MIRIERHPLVRRDLVEIVQHVFSVSGDRRAAARRLDEIEALLGEILRTPQSGVYLSDELSGWRERHCGRGSMIAIVFRLSGDGARLQVPVVAFGGQDWLGRSADRERYFDRAP